MGETTKTILITGSTDGIGLTTAKMLLLKGHHVLIHGRNAEKLKAVVQELTAFNRGSVDHYLCDLSEMKNVALFAREIKESHTKIDVLINNAGVYRTSHHITSENLDTRFAVNTIAPYLLTEALLPLLGLTGRIINLSSAAQAPFHIEALSTPSRFPDGQVYAQSKLAITMWSKHLADTLIEGPVVIAVNPGSMLGSKMVKEAYSVTGGDLRIGGTILTRLALEAQFSTATGGYFDNDSGRFANPHPDGMDPGKCLAVVTQIESILAKLL